MYEFRDTKAKCTKCRYDTPECCSNHGRVGPPPVEVRPLARRPAAVPPDSPSTNQPPPGRGWRVHLRRRVAGQDVQRAGRGPVI